MHWNPEFITSLERQYRTIRHDDVLVHQWLCHPERSCQDGCDAAADPQRLHVMDVVEHYLEQHTEE